MTKHLIWTPLILLCHDVVLSPPWKQEWCFLHLCTPSTCYRAWCKTGAYQMFVLNYKLNVIKQVLNPCGVGCMCVCVHVRVICLNLLWTSCCLLLKIYPLQCDIGDLSQSDANLPFWHNPLPLHLSTVSVLSFSNVRAKICSPPRHTA